MSVERRKKLTAWLIVLSVLLSGALFFVDLSIPLGVAGAVPYVIVVLVSLWLPGKGYTISLTVLCTVLTILGYFWSPPGGELWKVFANRFLAVFAIWVVATLSLLRKQAVKDLRKHQENLQDLVAERTIELREVNGSLQQEITDRKRVGDALERAHKEIKLLGHMRDFLQSSFGIEEAYATVSQFARKLLPGSSGALYLVSASRNVVEDVTHWGESLSTEPVFGPDECWALRRGTSHLVEDPSQIPVCQHMRGTPPKGCFLCVPMIAGGEALGVLYLEGLNKAQRLKKIWRERSWPSLWPELSPPQLQT